ncbi:MAG: hypothetical protein JWP97_5387 [Labilithrix sp.]|nr:hypothetical protein [Labilithrix sp.]
MLRLSRDAYPFAVTATSRSTRACAREPRSGPRVTGRLVVARGVVLARTRRAVVGPPGRERGTVERADRLPARRDEAGVSAACGRRPSPRRPACRTTSSKRSCRVRRRCAVGAGRSGLARRDASDRLGVVTHAAGSHADGENGKQREHRGRQASHATVSSPRRSASTAADRLSMKARGTLLGIDVKLQTSVTRGCSHRGTARPCSRRGVARGHTR